MQINLNITRKNILAWYKKQWKKDRNCYPWRIGKKTPYEILIAEILLQHTTAKAIIDNNCYTNFLKKFPSIDSIINIRRKEIEEVLKPIGLYNQKSERILKLKKKITNDYDGKIPDVKEELLSIPGIGEYIANAILTFVFDKNEVPLDNNLKRIALKVWNIKDKSDLYEFYKNLAKPNPKEIYWALFDIGRFHCRKPIPKCKGCPLKESCVSLLD